MERVVYHNVVDVLSLVTLASQILARHSPGDLDALSAPEALAVARWHQRAGRSQHAGKAYARARAKSEHSFRLEVLRYQTIYLKREGRHEEALDAWRLWHEMKPEDPRPSVELAKYYEWKAKDLEQAQQWANSALVSLSYWAADWRRDQAWDEIQHRLQRLARKIVK
jgi:tetratricopeptide (TPR) repeat protein